MSPFVFQMLCSIFAVKFIVVPDEEQARRIIDKWEGRDLTNVRLEKGRVSKQILERARPNLLQEFGEKLALAFGAEVDQLVAGITAKRAGPAPAAQVESSAAVLAFPPPERPKLAKVEAIKPRRGEPVSHSHLRVVQTRRKGARFGGML
jgi:hypothetical protein